MYKTDLKDTSRPKFYLLTMYDYPSGDLHIGHWYIKSPTDALARFRRMQGYNVFFPIGFDSFGLPAENAAIKSGGHPLRLDDVEHREDAPPAAVDGRDVRLDARGRHLRARRTTAGTSGSSCGSWRRAWPIASCRPSTGVPTTGRWRASRSRASTATAGAAAPWSRSATWSSGSCARPPTPTSCSTSAASTGPSRSASSRPTGSAARKAPRSTSRRRPTPHHPERRDAARLHDAARHAVRCHVHGPRAGAPARDRADGAGQARRGRRVHRAGPPADGDRPPVDRPREDRRRHRRGRDQPDQRRADPDLHRRLRAVRLRHRRDHGRARPRRARLRVREAVRPAHPARRRGARHRGRRRR